MMIISILLGIWSLFLSCGAPGAMLVCSNLLFQPLLFLMCFCGRGKLSGHFFQIAHCFITGLMSTLERFHCSTLAQNSVFDVLSSMFIRFYETQNMFSSFQSARYFIFPLLSEVVIKKNFPQRSQIFIFPMQSSNYCTIFTSQ